MEPQSETSSVIFMKILGGLAVFFSFVWLTRIFRGKDGKLDKKELKELVALLFFVGAGGYMIYKEGNRLDTAHDLYGVGWLAVVFGCLITVLHLEAALEKMVQLVDAFARLRAGTVTKITENTTINSETTVQQEQPKQQPLQQQS